MLRSIIKKKSETYSVNGETLTFHPVSPRILVENLAAFKSLMAVGSKLWEGRPILSQESSRAERDGSVTSIINPPDLSLVERAKAQRAADIESFMTELAKPGLRLSLAKIIVDSTRDEDLLTAKDEVIQAWIDDRDLDSATVLELLIGVYVANKATFGPFVQKVKTALAPHLTKVQQRMGKLANVLPLESLGQTMS